MTEWVLIGVTGWAYAAFFWYTSRQWERVAKKQKALINAMIAERLKQRHEVDRELH